MAVVANVKDYGAVGDGRTDDYSRVQAALDDLPGSGGAVVFPPGTYVVSNRLVSSDRPAHIYGFGVGNSIIKFTGTSTSTVGFEFNQRVHRNTFAMRDLTLMTDQKEAGDALTVGYQPADSYEYRIHRRVSLQNVLVIGEDITQHGFRRGMVMLHVNNPIFINCSVNGRQPEAGQENRTYTDDCFYLLGTDASVPAEASFYRCSGTNAKRGVHAHGSHEGLHVFGSSFVECAVGVLQDSSTSSSHRPGLVVSDTHCNIFEAGIRVANVAQGQIHHNLIYKSGDSSSHCNGVFLIDCEDYKVDHNLFFNQVPPEAEVTDRGFFGIATAGNTTRIQIFNNTVDNATCGIYLNPGTTSAYTWNNIIQGNRSDAEYVNDDTSGTSRYLPIGENDWSG